LVTRREAVLTAGAMMRRSSLQLLVSVTLIGLLLSGCGDSASSKTSTTSPTAPSTTSHSVQEPPLVYVAMGNSFTYWPSDNGAVNRYAEMLEADFGVEVDLREHTRGGQRAHDFLDRLVNDSPFDARLRADLAEADVITLLIPIAEWAEPMQTATGAEGRDPEDCGGDDNQQCMRDVIADYKALVGSVFEALTAIADPNETLIRVQDVHLFPTNASQDALDILYPFFADANEYVEKTAASYGIPVAHVFNEFAGPDGSINAEEAGLIGPDHRHPTDDGALRIAELIRNLGYERSTSSAAQVAE
jgi:lysophospholipase L1-like esterase